MRQQNTACHMLGLGLVLGGSFGGRREGIKKKIKPLHNPHMRYSQHF